MPYSGVQGDTIMFEGESSDTPKRKAPKAKAAKAPKAKKPKKCKYGIGADGFCKKKPRAAATTRVLSEITGIKVPKARAGSKQTSGERFERAVERHVVTKAVTGTARTAKALAKGAAAELAAYGGLKAVTKQLLLRPAFAGVTAAIVSNLAIAAAAGAASFLLTTKILNSIKDRKARAQQAAAAAADQFKATRLEAQARLGRPLTQPELQILNSELGLNDLIRKAGILK